MSSPRGAQVDFLRVTPALPPWGNPPGSGRYMAMQPGRGRSSRPPTLRVQKWHSGYLSWPLVLDALGLLSTGLAIPFWYQRGPSRVIVA